MKILKLLFLIGNFINYLSAVSFNYDTKIIRLKVGKAEEVEEHQTTLDETGLMHVNKDTPDLKEYFSFTEYYLLINKSILFWFISQT